MKGVIQFCTSTQIMESQGERALELSSRRRAGWLKNINRKDWTPGPGARVCSAHFITGKPAPLFDENNPDWTPTVNMGYETKGGDLDRYRHTKRRRLCASTSLEPEIPCETPCLPSTPSSDDTLPLAESVRGDGSGHKDASSQTDTDYVISLELDNASLRAEILQLKSNISSIYSELFRK